MIKVKEYLDENFYQVGNCTATLKDNGHYNVQGDGYIQKVGNLVMNLIICHFV